MLHHIEPFHIDELSEKGFKNFVVYCQKKGFVSPVMEKIKGLNYRQNVMQNFKGQLLLSTTQLLELIDKKTSGPYDIKRNESRTAWKFVGEKELQSAELVDILWQLAKPIFEK